MQRRTRAIAVTVAALLGLLGGGVTALLLDRQHGVDPLGVGVTMVNQSCTGKFLLVTGWGTSRHELGPGVAGDQARAHYLEVDRSCPTAWRPHGTRIHGYIAYLGPYDSAYQACSERVTRRGSFVTRLDHEKAGEQCLCVLGPATMPRLTPGMAVHSRAAIYVRALQDLLTTLGLIPPDHHFTGVYDPVTVQAIKEVQKNGALPQDGVVDTATWSSAIHQGCRLLTD